MNISHVLVTQYNCKINAIHGTECDDLPFQNLVINRKSSSKTGQT